MNGSCLAVCAVLVGISKDLKSLLYFTVICIFSSFAGSGSLGRVTGVGGGSLAPARCSWLGPVSPSLGIICLPAFLSSKSKLCQGRDPVFFYVPSTHPRGTWSMLRAEYIIAHPGMYERRKIISPVSFFYLKFPRTGKLILCSVCSVL